MPSALVDLITVWMAIHQTRAFFTNIRFEPENINLTWPGLFFTRWIVSFRQACASLAGTKMAY